MRIREPVQVLVRGIEPAALPAMEDSSFPELGKDPFTVRPPPYLAEPFVIQVTVGKIPVPMIQVAGNDAPVRLYEGVKRQSEALLVPLLLI